MQRQRSMNHLHAEWPGSNLLPKSGDREIMHQHKLSIPVEVEREKSFIAIQVRGGAAEEELRVASPLRVVDFTPMKLFHRLRKVLMRLIFTLPSSSRRGSISAAPGGDGSSSTDQPKTSCSCSYYTSNSHYSEAIADCIEFFNKSSEGILLDHQKTSDAHVMTIV